MTNKPEKGIRSGPEEQRLQGHWLLAKMGKRVLRPGGLELTQRIITASAPLQTDRVVEFGPGVGTTAKILLAKNPKSYIGVDPNPEGATAVAKIIKPFAQAKLVAANAKKTGLPTGEADLVVGEAMLTMHSDEEKLEIMQEAFRILAPGGRYAIHELGIADNLTPAEHKEINKALSVSIKVGARPLTMKAWNELLEKAGFTVTYNTTNPMHLLEPKRLIADEGLLRALKFICNVVRNKAARTRIIAMRKVFRENHKKINAVGIVATKPAQEN